MRSSRREFLRHSAAAGAIVSAPYFWVIRARGEQPTRRLKLAAIGVGGSRGAYSQGGAVASFGS